MENIQTLRSTIKPVIERKSLFSESPAFLRLASSTNCEVFYPNTKVRADNKPSINQSILFFNVTQATNSYFRDHRGEEQLKGKAGVGTTE